MDKVLRASKAGFPCARSLWYSVNSPIYGFQSNVSPKSQRIFDVGTALEPVIVEWLRYAGWDVEYNPGSQNAELEVRIPVNGGILAGHPDCIISKGNIQNALIDIKTMNDRSFTQWKREGSLKAKPQYVIQLHIYAMGLIQQGRDIQQLGIVGMNKNNSDLHIDFFPFNEATSADIIKRAETVFNSELENAPADNCPSEAWACGYCDFYSICNLHSSALRQDTVTAETFPITQDETIINAMKSLRHARLLAKQAKQIEEEAKDTLDENVKDKGLSSVQGGGLLFRLQNRLSSRFDSFAFKKAHPDLANEFTKQSVSTVYCIDNVSGDDNDNDI